MADASGISDRAAADIVRAVVRSAPVQAALQAAAEEIAGLAREVLAAHVDTGQSQIEVDHGDVDWFVVLVDDNAAAIEFVDRGNGAVAPLRRAVRAYGARPDITDGLT